MLSSSNLTTDDVLTAFTEEVAARGGRVIHTCNDGRRLWTRAVLALADDVRPNDQLNAGVALKANDDEVRVYPYIFRQVCSNGAIVAKALDSLSAGEAYISDADTALRYVREVVAMCCAAEVFEENLRKMREACDPASEMAITLLPLISRAHLWVGMDTFSRVVDEYFREGDRSRFGLANAVTAVARDTDDPDMRWNLEELGGGIAVGLLPKVPSQRGRAKRKRTRARVETA